MQKSEMVTQMLVLLFRTCCSGGFGFV